MGVEITSFGFLERMCFHFIMRYAFLFGIIYILLESLNVAFVHCQVDPLFANATFSPAASVFNTMIAYTTYLGVCFVDVTTVRALFV